MIVSDILSLILAVVFVFLNGCTQIIYAKSMGYKIKPTGCAYFIGAIGNLITGNIVPISAQSETLVLGGLIKDISERMTAFLLAAIVGIILGFTGLISHLVDFAGNIVLQGMMAGVGLILCNVSVDMLRREKRTGIISMIVALITWIVTKDLVYVIATSVVASTFDFCELQKRRVLLQKDENTEYRLWDKNYWSDFKLLIPKLTKNAVFGGLSLICLNIGTNISFGTISANMAKTTPNFDIITIINSVADIPSVLFGGMPIEVIISGTCSSSFPWLAGIIMMFLSGILLLSGLMIKISKYVPAQSIAGFLFIIGFVNTMIPNLTSVASSVSPLEGIVSASITMISKNAFLGIIAGIIVKNTGTLFGII